MTEENSILLAIPALRAEAHDEAEASEWAACVVTLCDEITRLREDRVVVHDMLGRPQHLHDGVTFHVSFTGSCPGCS